MLKKSFELSTYFLITDCRRETRLMPLIGERRTVRMSGADVRKLLAIQEGNTGSLEIEQLRLANVLSF